MNASTASSSQQSQAGFIGQATKFVSSMLGGSKKKAEPVKSLQLAAQAAKKVCNMTGIQQLLTDQCTLISNRAN